MKNVSRRRYAKLVKYLTETMENPQLSSRARFNAAMRLSEILLAADARAAKLEDRRYRAELRAQGQNVPEPVETIETPEPDHVRAVVDSITGKGRDGLAA